MTSYKMGISQSTAREISQVKGALTYEEWKTAIFILEHTKEMRQLIGHQPFVGNVDFANLKNLKTAYKLLGSDDNMQAIYFLPVWIYSRQACRTFPPKGKNQTHRQVSQRER